MFIATMIARETLPRAAVEALRDAWGGGEARWLNPGIAAEFDLAMMPENRWTVWDGLQAMGIDLAVQGAEGRRKRVLLADMDSTMIAQECIDELADMAGVGAQVAAITQEHLAEQPPTEAELETARRYLTWDYAPMPRQISPAALVAARANLAKAREMGQLEDVVEDLIQRLESAEEEAEWQRRLASDSQLRYKHNIRCVLRQWKEVM